MAANSRPDIDALHASLLRTVKDNTSPQQPDSVAEHVLVEQIIQWGIASTIARDVLVMLVDGGHLDRIDGAHEPRYRPPTIRPHIVETLVSAQEARTDVH